MHSKSSSEILKERYCDKVIHINNSVPIIDAFTFEEEKKSNPNSLDYFKE